jgi:CMP-N,N'-diacetyllegionaminic acid synthase
MNRLCTICARAGSKGVLNKNIRDLGGKPLIAHSIEQAQRSGLFDYIAVSSDSEAILGVAKDMGCDFIINRPLQLASDTAAKFPVIQHCALAVEDLAGTTFNTYVDLDATSPLRLVEDIINSVHLLETENCGNVITASPSRRSPYFNLVELDSDDVVQLSKSPVNAVNRRQDSPQCYDMNASIYVWDREHLMEKDSLFNEKTALYVMPESRSQDIDSELDFLIVEMLLKNRI